MTVKDIVIETIKYIYEHGRSIENGSCRYKAPNGNQCAVGRCMDMRKYRPHFEGDAVQGIAEHEDSHDDLLKVKYHGHPLIFWQDLQHLHDYSGFWDSENKLTPEGLLVVRRTLSCYEQDLTDEEYEELYS